MIEIAANFWLALFMLNVIHTAVLGSKLPGCSWLPYISLLPQTKYQRYLQLIRYISNFSVGTESHLEGI